MKPCDKCREALAVADRLGAELTIFNCERCGTHRNRLAEVALNAFYGTVVLGVVVILGAFGSGVAAGYAIWKL